MDLAKTQFLSLFTKAVTTALGIVQSILVIRLLSPAEFGLVGLVMSIGGLIGVSQHLGIVDGAIREIAVLKNKREIGKVFWVSHLTRQLVTIPLSFVLILAASFIATRIYGRPEIVPYIMLFAGVLILQGLQDVLGATLTGLRQFMALYIIQMVTAAINIAAFGYLTWQYGITGFFWAIIITTSIMVALLIAIVIKNLRGHLAWPSWPDLIFYGRRVMKIGVFMYISRILFVIWQRLPILVLGGVLASEELGYLNASLAFGARLTIIAAALSEVNLSWMSGLFVEKKEEFQKVVQHNMHRVLLFLMSLTLLLLFFMPEILLIIPNYIPAEPLILIMTTAFFLYALTDIGTSSLFVSANQPRWRAIIFMIMSVISGIGVAGLHFVRPDPLLAALAVLAGVTVAYSLTVFVARRRFGITFLTGPLAIFLVSLMAGMFWLLTQPSLGWRMLIFALLSAYILWESHRHELLPRFIKTVPGLKIICFAGATYDQISWTNRQHMMSRISEQYPVLYVEPRKWIGRVLVHHWNKPRVLLSFFKRVLWYERKNDRLFIKAQWNLIPWSREVKAIAVFNHYLNRFWLKAIALSLGFTDRGVWLWIYDTEAVEYFSAFPEAKVLYDCVDDHAAQAGIDRNPQRVYEEEAAIMQRATLVTVTSKKLFELKKSSNPNTHLVLNAGDVELFSRPQPSRPLTFNGPVFGLVGALDSYKIDVPLIRTMAQARPQWHIVFIGAPVVDQKSHEIDTLRRLPNVHFVGAVPRQKVPSYVQQFDVCLIPYRANQYNEASFPLKFWEFMATGKPIIVSGLKELKEYEGLIGYASSAQEFIQLGDYWLTHVTAKKTDRINLAREHTLEKRVETMLSLIRNSI